MRLTELQDSDRQEDEDLGLHHLKQTHPMMVLCPYDNFLSYVSCLASTRSGSKVVSHLLLLVDNQKSPETLSENDDFLKRHPEMSVMMQCIRGLWQGCPQDYFSVALGHLRALAVKIAYQFC